MAAPLNTAANALVLGAAACVGAVAFLPLFRTSGSPSPAAALQAHQVLVAERLLLAGAVLASGGGLALAVPVTCVALGLSLLTQQRMRRAYEFPPELRVTTAEPQSARPRATRREALWEETSPHDSQAG